MDIDFFLVPSNVLVDDWWQADHGQTPRGPAVRPCSPTPRSSPLVILAHWPRFRSERAFWRFAQAHLGGYFPKLRIKKASSIGACEPGAQPARVAADPRRGYRRALGPLPRPGHHPHFGDGPGDGVPQGAVRCTGPPGGTLRRPRGSTA